MAQPYATPTAKLQNLHIVPPNPRYRYEVVATTLTGGGSIAGGANASTREYCRRGRYFYDIWINAGSSNGFQYTPAHIAGYTESADFLDYTTSLNFASDRFAKGLEIRGFAPTNPP